MAWLDIDNITLPKAQAIEPILVGSIDLNQYVGPEHRGKIYVQGGYGYSWENTPESLRNAMNVKVLINIPYGETGVKQELHTHVGIWTRFYIGSQIGEWVLVV